jgi:hypothetical protein
VPRPASGIGQERRTGCGSGGGGGGASVYLFIIYYYAGFNGFSVPSGGDSKLWDEVLI